MPHELTIKCVEKAESLLADGSADSLLYAALQLRMGMENLFYEWIPLFKDELPDDIVTSKWQPQAILDALLECDPDFAEDKKIAISAAPPGEMNSENAIVKEVKAPTKKMLKDSYHRLGSYLHAPVDLVQPDIGKLRGNLEKIIEFLKGFKSNQILCNIRPLVPIPCHCGREIKRNVRAVEASGRMQCLNPACRIIYNVEVCGEEIKYSAQAESYPCPHCQTTNFVPVHRIKTGAVVECAECSKKTIVRPGFTIQAVDGKSGHGSAGS